MLQKKQRIERANIVLFNAALPTKDNNFTKLPTLNLPQHLLLMHAHLHTNLIQTMIPIQKYDQLCCFLSRPLLLSLQLLL